MLVHNKIPKDWMCKGLSFKSLEVVFFSHINDMNKQKRLVPYGILKAKAIKL